MRKCLVAILILALASPAAAETWTYEGGATPIAWFDNGNAQFQFACRGGQLAMGFWVRKPEAKVAGAAAMSLAITADDGGTVYAQDMPLVHLDGASVIVRGPVARQWARIAQNARTGLRLAFVRGAGGGLEMLDANAFAVRGSKSTIALVLDKCG